MGAELPPSVKAEGSVVGNPLDIVIRCLLRFIHFFLFLLLLLLLHAHYLLNNILMVFNVDECANSLAQLLR